MWSVLLLFVDPRYLAFFKTNEEKSHLMHHFKEAFKINKKFQTIIQYSVDMILDIACAVY